jgi:hypothetical protein
VPPVLEAIVLLEKALTGMVQRPDGLADQPGPARLLSLDVAVVLVEHADMGPFVVAATAIPAQFRSAYAEGREPKPMTSMEREEGWPDAAAIDWVWLVLEATCREMAGTWWDRVALSPVSKEDEFLLTVGDGAFRVQCVV